MVFGAFAVFAGVVVFGAEGVVAGFVAAGAFVRLFVLLGFAVDDEAPFAACEVVAVFSVVALFSVLACAVSSEVLASPFVFVSFAFEVVDSDGSVFKEEPF